MNEPTNLGFQCYRRGGVLIGADIVIALFAFSVAIRRPGTHVRIRRQCQRVP